jgi:ATP-binding cassette subfamily A (ABC1) protein 3
MFVFCFAVDHIRRSQIQTVMTISNLRQFGLLLWKNWLLQKRRIVLTVIQIFLPALFALVLFLIRTRVNAELVSQPTIWDSFEAGTALPVNLSIPVEVSPFNRSWQLAYTPDLPVVRKLVSAAADLINNSTKANPSTSITDDVGAVIGRG